MEVTAIILAGGKSSRFGKDKSLLMWNNQLIMQRLVSSCKVFAQEILIVSNQQNKFKIEGTKELSDIYPDMGPLGGLHTGLYAASCEKVFLTACDMPLMDARLAEEMLEQLDTYEAVLPCCEGRFQPMFTVFQRRPALLAAEEMLQRGEQKMLLLLQRLHTKYVECSSDTEQAFFNMNYLQDYHWLIHHYECKKEEN